MKQIITNYTFDKTAKTVTLTDFTTLSLNRLMLITNVTNSVIMYNFADPALTGSIAGNVITLNGFDTSGMNNSDAIQVIYDIQATDPDYQDPTFVSTELQTFKDDFDGNALDTTAWDATNNGMTPTVSGGILQIATGTTANASYVLKSKKAYRLPLRAQFTLSLSQRIANQTFQVALENAAGNTVAKWLFDGTVVTTNKVGASHNGITATADTGVTSLTTASQAIFELDLRADTSDFNDRTPESAAAANNRAVRTRSIPQPAEDLFIVIRVVNGAVAPASNTNMQIDCILLQQLTKNVVEIAAGRGNNVAGRAVPVNVLAAPTTSVNQATGINTSPWLAAGYGGLLVNDIVSAAITTTTTSGAVTPAAPSNVGTMAHQFNVAVTVVSGTTPTMDIQVQESPDNGTSWFPIYDFERITATGNYNSPLIRLTAGNRYRYVRTIAGTTPSFTMALNRNMVSLPGFHFRRFIDRSMVINTLNSVTPVYLVEGCDVLELVVAVGAITTTAPQVQLEGSETGISTDFYAIGAPLTAVASTAVRQVATNELPKFVRARISTAGSGATANYVAIKGIGRH